MEQTSTVKSPTFKQIVEKLQTLNEAELKQAYVRLFNDDINNQWKKLSEESSLNEVSEEEIDAAFLKSRYPNKYA
jgi:hypothetical protein